MRLVWLGGDLSGEGETVAFRSEQVLPDADVVVFDPAAARAEYDPDIERPGTPPTLSARGSNRLLADARRRRHDLEAALRRGRAVAVLVRRPDPVLVHTIEVLIEFAMEEVVPLHGMTTEVLRNNADLHVGGEPFLAFQARLEGDLVPEATVGGIHGETFLETSDGAAAGLYRYTLPGHLLFVPPPRPDAAARNRFAAALGRMVGRLRSPGQVPHLPEWADQLDIAGARDIAERLRVLEAQRADLVAEIGAAQRALAERETLKGLIAGAGRDLTAAAAAAFRRLDARVIEFSSRDDLLVVERDRRYAVILTRSPDDSPDPDIAREAAEEARALHDELGERAQAVVVINPQHALPPAERTVDPATGAFAEAAKAARVAWIAGADLADALATKAGRDGVIERLWSGPRSD